MNLINSLWRYGYVPCSSHGRTYSGDIFNMRQCCSCSHFSYLPWEIKWFITSCLVHNKYTVCAILKWINISKILFGGWFAWCICKTRKQWINNALLRQHNDWNQSSSWNNLKQYKNRHLINSTKQTSKLESHFNEEEASVLLLSEWADMLKITHQPVKWSQHTITHKHIFYSDLFLSLSFLQVILAHFSLQ